MCLRVLVAPIYRGLFGVDSFFILFCIILFLNYSWSQTATSNYVDVDSGTTSNGKIKLFTFESSSGNTVRIRYQSYYSDIELILPSGKKVFIDSKSNQEFIDTEQKLTESGTYTILAYHHSGGASQSFEPNYDNSVVVKDLPLYYKGVMIVYPNPSKLGKEIQVEFTYPEESLRHGRLIITSLNGAVVSTINQLQKRMVINGLRSGVYTINLVIDNKDCRCEKIIVV